jgi:exodeoxyribonuclease VII large subunit
VIQRVAIISSKTSAGAEDFLHTLENNPFGYRFWVDNYHTVVQGENNADQFLAKIIEVYNSGKPYDAVVIARGGGAQTDFLMFDSYSIGRAIARFPIPIITGIGHQKNETIADLMAHTQTKTPTKAAEFIIAHNRSYEDAVMGLQRRIVVKSQRMISNSLKEIGSIKQDVISSSRSMITSHQRTLDHFTSLVRIARPDNILKRGFAIVRSGNKILTDANTIDVGSNVDIVMSGSILNTTVNQKTKRDGAGTDI